MVDKVAGHREKTRDVCGIFLTEGIQKFLYPADLGQRNSQEVPIYFWSARGNGEALVYFFSFGFRGESEGHNIRAEEPHRDHLARFTLGCAKLPRAKYSRKSEPSPLARPGHHGRNLIPCRPGPLLFWEGLVFSWRKIDEK